MLIKSNKTLNLLNSEFQDKTSTYTISYRQTNLLTTEKKPIPAKTAKMKHFPIEKDFFS